MAILLPLSATETWAEHFTSRGWNTPQDQVNAGHPYFAQPAPAGGGWYEEEFDLGAVVSAAEVRLSYVLTTIAGFAAVTETISTRESSSDPWVDVVGASAFAVNFRYVKTRVAVADNGFLGTIDSLGITVNAQLITDSGTVMANAADGGGTLCPFNLTFAKVEAISLTPAGAAAASATYVFDTATLNPTSFAVLLFDAGGNRISGEVSWTARGY